MASQLLSGDLKPATFKIGKVNKEVGEEETYPEAIQAVQDLDDTWYAVMAASHLDADIRAIADFIQPMRKIYFTSTSSQLAYQQAQTVVYTATVEFDLTGAAEDDTIDIIIAGERYRSVRGASTWGAFAYDGQGSGTFAGTFGCQRKLRRAKHSVVRASRHFVSQSLRLYVSISPLLPLSPSSSSRLNASWQWAVGSWQ